MRYPDIEGQMELFPIEDENLDRGVVSLRLGRGRKISLEDRYGPLPDHSGLLAPFPYFGGKRKIAMLVWKRFGDVRSYVEPFAGSLAVLLNRPQPFDGPETVNDIDGLISNFWRALQADPETVAHYADWPVNENDLTARHAWIVERKDSLQSRLEGDPDYFDAKIAGWWCWGLCCWIGGEWCTGEGPWQVVDGQLVHLPDEGRGVNRRRVDLCSEGRGVNRQRVHLGNKGRGESPEGQCQRSLDGIRAVMQQLADRLRRVRVCCGDWARICGGNSGDALGHLIQKTPCGVFLDPPYSDLAIRDSRCYRKDDLQVAHAAREWAIRYGSDDRLRIALCGYEGEHVMPADWECVEWKAHGGMANLSDDGQGRENAKRERIWFSPYCIKVRSRLVQSVPCH